MSNSTNLQFVRSLTQTKASSQFWALSTLYGLVFSVQTANFYSWGLLASFLPLALSLLVASPWLGALLLSLDAWILRHTVRLLGASNASVSELKIALAWSKAPFILSFLLWVTLAVSNPTTVFIHCASNNSAVLVIFSTLILNAWVFALLARSIRNLQSFTLLRAFNAVFLLYCASFIFHLFVLFAIRYVYISFN